METAQTEQPNEGGMFRPKPQWNEKFQAYNEVPINASKFIYLEEIKTGETHDRQNL